MVFLLNFVIRRPLSRFTGQFPLIASFRENDGRNITV